MHLPPYDKNLGRPDDLNAGWFHGRCLVYALNLLRVAWWDAPEALKQARADRRLALDDTVSAQDCLLRAGNWQRSTVKKTLSNVASDVHQRL